MWSVHVSIAKTSKIGYKVNKIHSYVTFLDLLLKLNSLPAINTWTECTITNYHIHDYFPLNPLPNNKNFKLVQIQSICRQQIIPTQKLKFVLGKVEKMVGKGEDTGYQHFHLFPQCFQKLSFPEVLKSRDCVVKG